jgi:hypothetical protein
MIAQQSQNNTGFAPSFRGVHKYSHEIENIKGFSEIITIALCLTGKLDKNAISEPKKKGRSSDKILATLKNFKFSEGYDIALKWQ